MKQLPDGILANQLELREFHLDNTHLEKISNWLVKPLINDTEGKQVLKNLKYLSLQNNTRLKEIEPCLFLNIPNIERLYLTNNQLTFIPGM